MKTWDVFISHASEDKAAVAQPLAEALTRAGFAVWFDTFELRLGDSIRARIDQGLADSAFGVVILSPHFFAKQWTGRELNGLFAMDDEDRRILPVWHGLEREELRRSSPLLADRRATNTKFGIDYVAREIADVVRRGEDALARGGLAARMSALVEDGAAPEALSGLLFMHPSVVAELLNVGIGNLSVAARGQVAGHHVDLTAAIGRPSGSDGNDLYYFMFGPARTADDTGAVDARVVSAVETLRAIQRAFKRGTVPFSSPDDSHAGLVLASRRASIGHEQKKLRHRLRDSFIEVRTYDWLLDACVRVDQEGRRLGPRWGR